MDERNAPAGEGETGSRLALAGEAVRAAGRLKITMWLIGMLAALAVAWTLRETRMVTMPLAFAFFIAIAVAPVSGAVRARMPGRLRWLGPTAAMAVILVILGAFLAGLCAAAEQVAERLPGYAVRRSKRMVVGGARTAKSHRTARGRRVSESGSREGGRRAVRKWAALLASAAARRCRRRRPSQGAHSTGIRVLRPDDTSSSAADVAAGGRADLLITRC